MPKEHRVKVGTKKNDTFRLEIRLFGRDSDPPTPPVFASHRTDIPVGGSVTKSLPSELRYYVLTWVATGDPGAEFQLTLEPLDTATQICMLDKIDRVFNIPATQAEDRGRTRFLIVDSKTDCKSAIKAWKGVPQ